MADTHEARIEAAAKLFYESQGGANYETSLYRENWYAIAKRALAAADAVVTLEKIAQVIRYEVISAVGVCVCGEGYTIRNMRDPHCEWHSLGESFAEDTAPAVHALLTGEEQS